MGDESILHVIKPWKFVIDLLNQLEWDARTAEGTQQVPPTEATGSAGTARQVHGEGRRAEQPQHAAEPPHGAAKSPPDQGRPAYGACCWCRPGPRRRPLQGRFLSRMSPGRPEPCRCPGGDGVPAGRPAAVWNCGDGPCQRALSRERAATNPEGAETPCCSASLSGHCRSAVPCCPGWDPRGGAW